MTTPQTPSLAVNYRRRFFQPGNSEWDNSFFEFIPWQFASWQRWRSGTKEMHPEQNTVLLSMSPPQLYLVFTNADLLLFLLSTLSSNEFDTLIRAGKGEVKLPDEFRRPLMRRHHALWLVGREYSVSESSISEHPNHKLFDDLSPEKQAEHLAFIDFHATLLFWLSEHQSEWLMKFRTHLENCVQVSEGLLLGMS